MILNESPIRSKKTTWSLLYCESADIDQAGDDCMLSLSSGVDFDDAEYGFKEEDKDAGKVIHNHLRSDVLINTHRNGTKAF